MYLHFSRVLFEVSVEDIFVEEPKTNLVQFQACSLRPLSLSLEL